MKNKSIKRGAVLAAAGIALSLAACGRSVSSLNTGEKMQVVDLKELQFPLAKKKTLPGMIS